MDEAVLETSGLSKVFGLVRAVDDVSLCVRRGDVYGFLGLNGAGKTTTMRMVLDLIRPTAGSVTLFGRDDAAGRRDARSRLGAMVEGPAFYPHLSGRQNLRTLGSLTAPITSSRVDDVLERVGLGDARRKKAGAYSLGMKQRLGIALAILSEPEFVVLDEPTNGLDPNGILEMRHLIRSLNQDDGVTFMISSHLLHEIELTCNRVGILERGRLILESTMDDVAAKTGGRYRLVVDRPDVAAPLVEARPGCRVIEVTDRDVVFEAVVHELPAIHAALHETELVVFTLSEERINLEEFFLNRAERTEGALT